MIDFSRALYSHCDHSRGRASHIDVALDLLMERLMGVAVVPTRVATFLQGATVDLPQDHEFRLHVWCHLPQAHPRFPTADRGLFCLVRAVDERGLLGTSLGGVGWLGTPLRPHRRPRNGDWIDAMVEAQGYEELPDAEWLEPCGGPFVEQVLSFYLARHLEDMINHTILEERLARRG